MWSLNVKKWHSYGHDIRAALHYQDKVFEYNAHNRIEPSEVMCASRDYIRIELYGIYNK